MASWEEIKRLAADFQRTQESDTLQRISERNCIDIVKKLTELNLIELIYTCDGKEFLTPAHLLKEIEDEVYVCGGRVHLHDLAANLNVDYQHVENRAKELVKERPEYNLVLGQIIHSDYKNTLGKQIQDTMLFNGQLNIADFAKTLDLPSDFLLTLVKEVMPTVIDDFVVSQDERTYYTTDIMDRYKSIVAGTLSAITRPTTMASIMKKLGLAERLFSPIVDGLIKEGRIDAAVENKLFIPSVYAREQNEWIDKFYESNSYIEYDVLTRMDIKQPKAFLKKRFQNGVALKTCFVGSSLISQVESLIEESIASNSWLDMATILPPAIQSDDVEMLIGDTFKKCRQFSTSSILFNQTIVCSLGFIATCKKSLVDIMPNTAQEHLKQGKLISHFLAGQAYDPRKRTNSGRKSESEKFSQNPDTPSSQADAVKSSQAKDDKDESLKNDSAQQQDQSQSISEGQKKNKNEVANESQKDVSTTDFDKDEGKKGKSRKSGGGAQGREIKQRAVKKKYLPGNKGNRRGDDDSDDEPTSSAKTSRSKKGRAARRGVSPDRTPKSNKEAIAEKEPLIFMTSDEIAEMLKKDAHNDDSLEQLMDIIAERIESDLNSTYETVARQTLDEHLKSQNNKESQEAVEDDDSEVEVIE